MFVTEANNKINLKFVYLLQRGMKDTSHSEESEESLVESEAESVTEHRVTRRSAAGIYNYIKTIQTGTYTCMYTWYVRNYM